MREVLGVGLMLMGLVASVICAIGLVNPKWAKLPGTTNTPKRLQFLLMGTVLPIACFVAGAIVFPPDAPTAASPAPTTAETTQTAATSSAKPSAAPQPKNLGVSPEEFRRAYNGIMGQVDKNWRIPELVIDKGEVNDTFTAKLGAAAHLVGVVDKASGKIREITAMVAGSGTEDNLHTTAALFSVASAATIGASKQEVSQSVTSLMTTAFDRIDDANAKPTTTTVGNRKFSAFASRHTGLMLSISDAQ